MKSAECVAVILDDIENQEGIWKAGYERVKNETTAELADDCPKEVMSIYQLKFDESTRRLMYADWQDFKTKVMAEIRSDSKPWTRLWRKKVGDETQRSFSIYPLDFAIAVYEKNGVATRIEYYSETSLVYKDGKENAFVGEPVCVSEKG